MTPRNATIGTPSSDTSRWAVGSGIDSRQAVEPDAGEAAGQAADISKRAAAHKSAAAEQQFHTVKDSATRDAAGHPASNFSSDSLGDSAGRLKAQVQHCIGPELGQVEKLLRGATASRYEEVAELSQAAAAMGGKRLRPTLVWLSAQATNRTELSHSARRDLSSIAAAVELVHAASLVHDDVMDHATHRRHQLTIAGKSGNSAAVLLGDLLFTRAYALAAGCGSTYPARLIAVASTRLCEGELRQQASVRQWQMTHAHYRSLLLQKTGALCGVSCRLGAWRAGADSGQARSLAKFGRLLGLAFQIHDDWLDYWGTDEVGKTLGTDLAQAKPTLPIIRLVQSTPPAGRAELIELLNEPTAAARRAIQDRLDASDAGDYTLRIARRCSEHAKRELLALPPSPARESLAAVADYSVRRAV